MLLMRGPALISLSPLLTSVLPCHGAPPPTTPSWRLVQDHGGSQSQVASRESMIQLRDSMFDHLFAELEWIMAQPHITSSMRIVLHDLVALMLCVAASPVAQVPCCQVGVALSRAAGLGRMSMTYRKKHAFLWTSNKMTK